MTTAQLQDAFEAVYSDGRWGVGFGSGHGSRPWATLPYRMFLRTFIRWNGIRSVLDYGCGDWEIGRRVDWQGASYTGVDVVPELIERNQREFGRPGVSFIVAPAEPEQLPVADLLLCKDVLQHLPNADIETFLRRVVPRYPRTLLINDSPGQAAAVNRDIEPGQWRRVDVRLPPFDAEATVVGMLRMPPALSRDLTRFRGGRKPIMLLRGASPGPGA